MGTAGGWRQRSPGLRSRGTGTPWCSGAPSGSSGSSAPQQGQGPRQSAPPATLGACAICALHPWCSSAVHALCCWCSPGQDVSPPSHAAGSRVPCAIAAVSMKRFQPQQRCPLGFLGMIYSRLDPFPAAQPSQPQLLAEHGLGVGSSPAATGGLPGELQGHRELRSRGCAGSSEGPGWRAACGWAVGVCCASLGGEEQLPRDLPQSPVGRAPCASKRCSWPSSAAELCHSSVQTLNPWINCQGTTVHKHVHSWEAGLPLTCGMLLAPLYLICNSMSELGHCGCCRSSKP